MMASRADRRRLSRQSTAVLVPFDITTDPCTMLKIRQGCASPAKRAACHHATDRAVSPTAEVPGTRYATGGDSARPARGRPNFGPVGPGGERNNMHHRLGRHLARLGGAALAVSSAAWVYSA